MSKIIHHWLRIPYMLHIRYKRTSKPLKTTYVLIHGLADTGELWKPLLASLPKNSNYIVVDLLGHGKSKHPSDSTMYSAPKQAQSVLATCLRAGLSGPVVLIGHSFGALVASEFAHGYRGVIRQIILVSPPIYRNQSHDKKDKHQQEQGLRTIYREALKKPKLMINLYNLGDKLKLVGFSDIKLNQDNFSAIANTLKSGIINQRAGERLIKSTVPTTIIYGRFDPLLVPKNFHSLKSFNPNITIKPLLAGHAVKNSTLKTILRQIDA